MIQSNCTFSAPWWTLPAAVLGVALVMFAAIALFTFAEQWFERRRLEKTPRFRGRR